MFMSRLTPPSRSVMLGHKRHCDQRPGVWGCASMQKAEIKVFYKTFSDRDNALDSHAKMLFLFWFYNMFAFF